MSVTAFAAYVSRSRSNGSLIPPRHYRSYPYSLAPSADSVREIPNPLTEGTNVQYALPWQKRVLHDCILPQSPPVCQEFFSLNIFIPSTGPVQIAENPYGFGTKPHNQTPVLCHMTVTNNHPKIHSDENYFHNAHTFFTFFNINP